VMNGVALHERVVGHYNVNLTGDLEPSPTAGTTHPPTAHQKNCQPFASSPPGFSLIACCRFWR